MTGRALRTLLVAVVVGLLVVVFYDWAAGPGDRPDGMYALAGLVGVIVAVILEGIRALITKARNHGAP